MRTGPPPPHLPLLLLLLALGTGTSASSSSCRQHENNDAFDGSSLNDPGESTAPNLPLVSPSPESSDKPLVGPSPECSDDPLVSPEFGVLDPPNCIVLEAQDFNPDSACNKLVSDLTGSDVNHDSTCKEFHSELTGSHNNPDSSCKESHSVRRCAQRELNTKQQLLGTAAPALAPLQVTAPGLLANALGEDAGKAWHSAAAETTSPMTTLAVSTTTAPPPPPTTVDPHAPYVDRAHSKNVTALLGKTAYLNCRVKNLGNKTVSWVRHRDIHLLTVARYTYTNDQRFRATHNAMSDDWMLQLKYPQHRDAGVYECQVSTTPHLSHFIHLSVVEPKTEIIGAPELFIDRGSTINLTCIILHSPEPPAYVFWNHNDSIISYESPRGGVEVQTARGDITTSVLLIRKAKPSDSGQYKCNPSNAQSQQVHVNVLNGELPAAMQHGGQGHHQTSHLAPLLVTALAALLWHSRSTVQVS